MSTPTRAACGPDAKRVTVTLDAPQGCTPDLYVQAADGVWCAAFAVRDRILDGVYVTSIYIHHPAGTFATTAERVAELRALGRVAEPGDFVVVVEAAAPTPDRAPSPRLRLLDESGPSRWEKLRRLLNARCGQYERHTGEVADDVRHGAATYVSDGRTRSSMDLTESEVEDAVTFVEHLLWEADFDLDAADEAYRLRRARRLRQAA